MRNDGSDDATAAVMKAVRSRRSSFYRWPQFRLIGLLGWALLATGGAGWAKYHLDLAAEEEQVLQGLSEAGCTVDVIRSYREADFDGRYGDRFWYEPPFLERVRELRVSGKAPPALLVRAASLPSVTKFAKRDYAWGRESSESKTLGQAAPELPATQLSERDFPSEIPKGAPVERAEAEASLQVIRDSWNKPRELPERFVLHGFEADRSVYGSAPEDYFTRTLAAQDATRALLQQASNHLVELSDSNTATMVTPDGDDAWTLQSRAPDFSTVYVRRHLSVACRVKSLPTPKVETVLLEGKPAQSWADSVTVRIEGPTIRRVDESTLRIDAAEIARWDDEAGATVQRHARTFVVSETCDWLPIAKREELTVTGLTQRRSVYSEAFRYAIHDREPYLTEQLRVRESENGQSLLRARYAWDFDPQFDETSFDPRRFVGPELAEPGAYPFRWYWFPFVGGAIVLAVRFFQRCTPLLRRGAATAASATSA